MHRVDLTLCGLCWDKDSGSVGKLEKTREEVLVQVLKGGKVEWLSQIQDAQLDLNFR